MSDQLQVEKRKFSEAEKSDIKALFKIGLVMFAVVSITAIVLALVSLALQAGAA
ncbi:hypothetical protein MASR2M15_05040 [Anaerolineales bacterium]